MHTTQSDPTVKQGSDIDKREGAKTIYREPLSVVFMPNEAIAPASQTPVTPLSVAPDTSPTTPDADLHLDMPVPLDFSSMSTRDYPKHANLGNLSFERCHDVEANMIEILNDWNPNEGFLSNKQISILSLTKNLAYKSSLGEENTDDQERHGFRYHARKLFGKE